MPRIFVPKAHTLFEYLDELVEQGREMMYREVVDDDGSVTYEDMST